MLPDKRNYRNELKQVDFINPFGYNLRIIVGDFLNPG